MIARGLQAVALSTVALGVMSGCAVQTVGTAQPSTSTSVVAPTAPGSSGIPTELAAEPATYEQRIGSLSSVRGVGAIGPVPSRTGRAAVYIRCLGDGILTVEVEDSATFTQQCVPRADDPGTRNTLDILGENVRVTGSADASNLWAVTVTEIPAD